MWTCECAGDVDSAWFMHLQTSAVEGFVLTNSMPPRSTTAVGRGGDAAMEAKVGVGITPEVFFGFFLGWPLLGVGFSVWGVAFGAVVFGSRLLTVRDSVVMDSFMLRISLRKASEGGVVGLAASGSHPRIWQVVGLVRKEW